MECSAAHRSLTVVLTLLLAATAHAAVIKPPLRTSGAKIVDRDGAHGRAPGRQLVRLRDERPRRARAVVARPRRRHAPDPAAWASTRSACRSRCRRWTPPRRSRGRTSPAARTPRCRARRRSRRWTSSIDAAARAGLMVLLENHSLADDGYSYGLWYGQAGYDENAWVARWQALARRYRDRSNVIGADLKNEPHGDATWGTGGPTDWRRAATRAGNAVTAIAPNWLIVVEGIEKPVAGGKLSTHWWGGNLEGVRRNPVRLQRANRLVYSPHEYGPGVFPQPWFGSPTRPSSSERALARRLGVHRRAGHRAAADRRVRRPQGRPRQRRGPLAAPVPRPPRAHRHLLDVLGAEPRLGRHRRRAVRRLDDAGRHQARAAAAHDPPPAHRVQRRGERRAAKPRPTACRSPSLSLDLRVRMA